MFVHSPNCLTSHFLQDSLCIAMFLVFGYLPHGLWGRSHVPFILPGSCFWNLSSMDQCVTAFRTWHMMWTMSSYLLYIPCHLDSWFFFFNSLNLLGCKASCKGSQNKVFLIIEKKKSVLIFLMVKSFKDARLWNGSFINLHFNNSKYN